MTENRALRMIGYWYSEAEFWLPHAWSLVDLSWDSAIREAVAGHLDKGAVLHEWMGFSPCRLCDLQGNGSRDLYDGVYVWPEGLSHYVRDHKVRLPETFVQHALKQQGTHLPWDPHFPDRKQHVSNYSKWARDYEGRKSLTDRECRYTDFHLDVMARGLSAHWWIVASDAPGSDAL